MLCERNGCEILFYWLRRWCSEASASSVLKQPPCCQRSELLYEALSAAALSPAGYVGQALLSVTLSLYLHGKGGCGKARCCAALPQTEQSWRSSPESQRGTPGTWGCGSVTGLPTQNTSATVISGQSKTWSRDLFPPAHTRLSLLALFFLVPNEMCGTKFQQLQNCCNSTRAVLLFFFPSQIFIKYTYVIQCRVPGSNFTSIKLILQREKISFVNYLMLHYKKLISKSKPLGLVWFFKQMAKDFKTFP